MHIIGHLAGRIRSGQLAFIQYGACAIFSMIVAVFAEPIEWHAVSMAAVPILYGGLFSVGIAYSLQIIGQKYAPPSHAVIFLSMESVFAVVGGWLLLSEQMPLRGLFGCGLMFTGMLISQLGQQKQRRRERNSAKSAHN
ncbi:MAG: DMT family transporter [candidate division KSB1 bacterium]|nr:DMT family transporter [candidate division KSB1 bacterium]